MSADGDMGARGASGPGSLSVTGAEELDRVCDQFEAEWRAGGRPRIEDRLVGVAGPERTPLVCELLVIELHWRRKAGERPDPAEYLGRLLEDAEAVHATFGRTETLGVVAGPPPGPPPMRKGLVDPASCRAELSAGDPLAPDVRTRYFGDYELIRELGRGGMGVVYEARQISLNRPVALKRIRAAALASDDELRRFRNEAEAVAQLDHPNIVPIFEVGRYEDQQYFSMKLVAGGGLDQRLQEYVAEPRRAARLVAVTAAAIHHAHQRGILHRDLKPANIVVDADGQPHVTDFGLSKRVEGDSELTQSGAILGTPAYMAPEQASGRRSSVTTATDIYGLGAVLYALLTGRGPFGGTTVLETLDRVRERAPEPPHLLNPRVPRDLEVICLKCLSKVPARRYTTADDLAADLDRFLAGEPIRARPTPFWERAAKWARRHPTAATLVALAAASLVAIAFAVSHYNSASVQRALRETARVAGVRSRVDRAIFDGQRFLAEKNWPEARLVLSNVLTRIKEESRLGAERARAAELLAQADRGSAEQGEREAERRRFEEFLRSRDEALFYETQFTGLDLPGNLEKSRSSARAALGIFADKVSARGWVLGPLPGSLSEAERSAVRERCYELLLILAEAEDRPDDGLAMLDAAARLDPTPNQAYHLRRAACLSRKGDRAGVDEELRRAGTLAPATAFDQFLIGQERYKRRDWAGSLKRFDAALRLQPDHFWAQALSAICSLQLQHPTEAKAALNACLSREAGFAWLYVLRGFASGRIASQARGADRRARGRVDAVRQDVEGQFEAAEFDYRKALELLRDRPGDELQYVVRVNRGLMWLERGRLAEAESDLRDAVRLNDRHFQAFAALAEVYQQQGRPNEAVAEFGNAIALRPDWAPLYRGRADVTVRRKGGTLEQRRAALRDLEESVRLESPGSLVLARDHTNLGRLLYRDGRVEESLAACDAALAVVPDYLDAHLLRIGALLDLRRYDEVIRSCDAVLAKGKPSADLYELRGLARIGRRDFAGAIEDDTLALALRPGSIPLLTRRGWSYLVSNAHELALRDFEEALRLDPSNADAYNGRGTARARLGRHREAAADAEEALRHGEPSSRTVYNAARVYAQAASVSASEARRKGRDAVLAVVRYQDRAIALVHEAVERLPAERRALFWRDQVLADPSLRPIRHRLMPFEPTTAVTSGPTPRN